MSTTVLLVGGFGNLGGRIAYHLSENSDCNIVISSRSKREIPSWAKDVQVVELDITNPSTFVNIPKQIDSIVQLAATNDAESANNPELAHLTTTAGTSALAKEAVNRHVQKFIFFSTAHVYGSPLSGDLTEESPTNGTHPYATSHLAAEHVISRFHQNGEMMGINVRLSNGYGRPMNFESGDWRTLTSDLCRQVVVERRLELRTDGQQQRNFITKTDIARAVYHFLTIPQSFLGNGVFNLGGSHSQTLLSMAKLIQHRAEVRFNSEIPLIHPQAVVNEPNYLNFEIKKLLTTGFSLTENSTQEIDNFLEMIEKHFHQ